MAHEEKFSQDIDNFTRYGTYTYKFDEVGNVAMSLQSEDFSKVYLAFPLNNFVYDSAKIESFYDAAFTEFIPASQIEQKKVAAEIRQVQADLVAEKEKNAELTAQLDTLITSSESDSSKAASDATKQVILELRKELGQGRVESDFSTDFPYTPIVKESRE